MEIMAAFFGYVYHTADASSHDVVPQTIIAVAVAILMIASVWNIFSKAGQRGWAAIIPIYETLVLLRVVKRPWWWIVLLLIPLVNIVVHIVICNDLAKAFGKGAGYTLLLIFLPFIGYPLLAFGSAQYQLK